MLAAPCSADSPSVWSSTRTRYRCIRRRMSLKRRIADYMQQTGEITDLTYWGTCTQMYSMCRYAISKFSSPLTKAPLYTSRIYAPDFPRLRIRDSTLR